MSRADAKNIVWPAMIDIDQRYNLGLEFKENTGEVVLPNKSRILLRGAGSMREINKLRGPKYPCGVVDEAQGFGSDLLYMLDEVLGPAVSDYNGWLAVTGTPNAACAGPFHRICTNRDLGWEVHSWTVLDNPFHPMGPKELAAMRKRRGWAEDTPAYMREYLGLWVRDVEGLVFEFDPYRHIVPTFDPEDARWSYVLGIDLGYNDPTAFVVIAYSTDSGKAVVVESYKESGLIPSSAAVRVERFRQKYPLERIVADSGGFGKGYLEEWRQKFGIDAEPAQKTKKLSYISMLNGDLNTNSLVIAGDRNKALIEELTLLQWDSDKMLENRWEADRKFDDHLADAFLYAWRECQHNSLDWDRSGSDPYSHPTWTEEEESMWQNALERYSCGEPFWKR